MKETDQLNDRIDNIEEIVDYLVKNNTAMEKQMAKIPEMVTTDYSAALDTLTDEIRKISQNDTAAQSFALLMSINEKLNNAPKPVVRQIRISLFPERNQGDDKKVVRIAIGLGRLIPWILCFVAATYIFIIGYKVTGTYSYNQELRQSAHYKRAWIYLRKIAKKKTLSAMDTAYFKTADK